MTAAMRMLTMAEQVDLAPHNPYSLVLQTPVIVHAPPMIRVMLRLAALEGVGALLTAPIGGRRRTEGRIHEVSSGVLLTVESWRTAEALRSADEWPALAVPVLALLAADHPHDLEKLIVEFAEEAPPAGFVIDVGDAPPEMAAALVSGARAATPLPILAALRAVPGAIEQALAAQEAGAEALLLLYGPEGAIYSAGSLHHGLLDGPAAEPMLLNLCAALCGLLPELPVISLAASREGAAALLAAGARAILLRAGLWRDPTLAAQIASSSR